MKHLHQDKTILPRFVTWSRSSMNIRSLKNKISLWHLWYKVELRLTSAVKESRFSSFRFCLEHFMVKQTQWIYSSYQIHGEAFSGRGWPSHCPMIGLCSMEWVKSMSHEYVQWTVQCTLPRSTMKSQSCLSTLHKLNNKLHLNWAKLSTHWIAIGNIQSYSLQEIAQENL